MVDSTYYGAETRQKAWSMYFSSQTIRRWRMKVSLKIYIAEKGENASRTQFYGRIFVFRWSCGKAIKSLIFFIGPVHDSSKRTPRFYHPSSSPFAVLVFQASDFRHLTDPKVLN